LPFATLPFGDKAMMSQRKNTQSIEERCFQFALICLEIRYDSTIPAFALKAIPLTMVEVKKMIATTLEKSLHKPDVRYTRISCPITILEDKQNLHGSTERNWPRTLRFGYG
jgi:hypothetical protein